MVQRYRHSSLLPIILSQGVRVSLNFDRSSELEVSCQVSKSELLEMLDMITRSRMELDEENLQVLHIIKSCFGPNSPSTLKLWLQLCWRLNVKPKKEIATQMYIISKKEG